MNTIGTIIHQRRRELKLTLQRLRLTSGVSASHVARIERGERFPSARILQKLAKPLDFSETELFTQAGYFSEVGQPRTTPGLNPYVARFLALDPAKVQLVIIEILGILHNLTEVEHGDPKKLAAAAKEV